MINLIKLGNTNLKEKIKKLYMNEFPEYERYPFWLLLYKSKKRTNDFYVIYDDEEYIGLIYLVYYKDIVYVLYLSIDPSHQSKGYGSKVLNHLSQLYQDKRLLLNIEKVDKTAVNYEQRYKRKKFYEKNGFKNTNFEIAKEDIVYEILFLGQGVYEHEYHALFKAYLGEVLHIVF